MPAIPITPPQKVLVTGAGTGIGRAIALEFGRQGASVALHYGPGPEDVANTLQEIQQAGGRAEAFFADFNDIDQIVRLTSEATEFLGGLDVLVNNAGITMNRPFEAVTPALFDTLYNVNIRAPFFLIQGVLPLLRAQNAGIIVNMASVHAYEGLQEHSVYAGTKGAVVAFTRQLAIELAPHNIRVNAIAPGSIQVEAYDQAIAGFDAAAAGEGIPAGYVGQPADIAGVALFLASPAARYIVGQTLVVDGGTTSWMPFGDGFRQPLGFSFGANYLNETGVTTEYTEEQRGNLQG